MEINGSLIAIRRTNSDDADFIELVQMLDKELAERDGSDHSFYSQFNKIDKIRHAVVAYSNSIPVSCGTIKEFNSESMEVKRMYTVVEYRGRGLAARVLAELEHWASELSYNKTVLETGKRQPEAIRLYIKSGYSIIPNYGQYIGIENSVCFEKLLQP